MFLHMSVSHSVHSGYHDPTGMHTCLANISDNLVFSSNEMK